MDIAIKKAVRELKEETLIQFLPDRWYYRTSSMLIPAAGNGNIIEQARKRWEYFQKEMIYTVEINDSFSSQYTEKYDQLIGYDFLKFETFTEFDTILMCPPETSAYDFFMKAYYLAMTQVTKKCHILSILPSDIVSIPQIDEALTYWNAEKHEVIIVDRKYCIISLYVDTPKTGLDHIYSETFSDQADDQSFALSTILADMDLQNRLLSINKLIQAYQSHAKLIKRLYQAHELVEHFESKINDKYEKQYLSIRPDSQHVTLNEALKNLRSGYWQAILHTEEFTSRLTTDGRQIINNQIKAASIMEITPENLQVLLNYVLTNNREILEQSCVAWFKKITTYSYRSYSDNLQYYNGWVTNDPHKVNKKIIVPLRYSYFVFGNSTEFHDLCWAVKDFVSDLIKMFQLLDPDIPGAFTCIGREEFENDFIRFKLFMNGNIHIWFKDLDILNKFNFICGQSFKWLPTDDEIRNNPEAKEYVEKEFGPVNKYLMID